MSENFRGMDFFTHTVQINNNLEFVYKNIVWCLVVISIMYCSVRYQAISSVPLFIIVCGDSGTLPRVITSKVITWQQSDQELNPWLLIVVHCTTPSHTKHMTNVKGIATVHKISCRIYHTLQQILFTPNWLSVVVSTWLSSMKLIDTRPSYYLDQWLFADR